MDHHCLDTQSISTLLPGGYFVKCDPPRCVRGTGGWWCGKMMTSTAGAGVAGPRPWRVHAVDCPGAQDTSQARARTGRYTSLWKHGQTWRR
eukprot:gene24073-biopygen14917